MSIKNLGILLLALLWTGLSACSGSKNAGTSGSDSSYPEWYAASGFSSDSLSFYGYATAVSSDSAIAVANAALQAKSSLESALASKLEEIREEMEENGSSEAAQKEFILMLRKAHQLAETSAEKGEGKAVNKDQYYLGYAEAKISKRTFHSLLQDSFRGSGTYWKALSNAPAFVSEFGQ